ncbi:unnamed protein product [Prunus armeniaca]|uniref:Uncharacterized protein n=1 Tax=Prunus armeniaca TaxID=36596 RepID=A0A6J5V7J5_PRUAR|nr:unnamed protein product [Prunus armeniaca]CAB4315409.1 unnamed protein product [Prunus armeniaca]
MSVQETSSAIHAKVDASSSELKAASSDVTHSSVLAASPLQFLKGFLPFPSRGAKLICQSMNVLNLSPLCMLST